MNFVFPRTIYQQIIFLLGVSFSFSHSNFSLTDYAILAVGFGAAFYIIQKKDFIWIFEGFVHKAALIFALFVFLSFAFLPNDQAFFGLITLYLIGSFFLFRYLVRFSFQYVLFTGYVVGAVLVSSISVAIYLFLKQTILFDVITIGSRLAFFFSDPNVFAAFLVPPFLALLAYLLFRSTSNLSTVFTGLCFVFILTALILSGSRGAWIQCLVAVSILLYLQYSRAFFLERKLVLKLVLKRVFILLFVSLFIIVVTIQLSGGKTSSFRYFSSDLPRIENVDYAYTAIMKRDPKDMLTGLGNGSYETFSENGFSAHNTYVRLMFENGLLGIAAFFVFLFFLIKNILRKRNDMFVNVLFASVAGIMVHSLFIDTLHWRHLWFMLGLF